MKQVKKKNLVNLNRTTNKPNKNPRYLLSFTHKRNTCQYTKFNMNTITSGYIKKDRKINITNLFTFTISPQSQPFICNLKP